MYFACLMVPCMALSSELDIAGPALSRSIVSTATPSMPPPGIRLRTDGNGGADSGSSLEPNSFGGRMYSMNLLASLMALCASRNWLRVGSWPDSKPSFRAWRSLAALRARPACSLE